MGLHPSSVGGRGRAPFVVGILVALGVLAVVLTHQSCVGAAQPAELAPKAQETVTGHASVALAEPEEISRTSASLEVAQAEPGPAVPVAPTGSDATISGRVINDIGEPVEGATVRAELQAEEIGEEPEPQAVSDRDGRFTIQGCTTGGTYALGAELGGLWPKESVLAAAGVDDVELVLLRSGGI